MNEILLFWHNFIFIFFLNVCKQKEQLNVKILYGLPITPFYQNRLRNVYIFFAIAVQLTESLR